MGAVGLRHDNIMLKTARDAWLGVELHDRTRLKLGLGILGIMESPSLASSNARKQTSAAKLRRNDFLRTR